MASERDRLFSEREMYQEIATLRNKLSEEIASLDPNQVLNTSVDTVCDLLLTKYLIIVPSLLMNDITADQEETNIDVSQDPNRIFLDRSRPTYVQGTAISYFVPFTGDSYFFHMRPSQRTLSAPHARVERDRELVFTYNRVGGDADEIRSAFEHDLRDVGQWLKSLHQDADSYNANLRGEIKQRIEARRSKVLADRHLAANLGYPLRRRNDSPTTFVVPEVRRKITPANQPSEQLSSAPFAPEPTLDVAEYDHILSIMSNMVTVMERSPHAFQALDEEDLRTHFLVQLNAQYEGQATGETFNYTGKTDILIRNQGHNLFIAECKFWDGQEKFIDTIDQLLGYVTWRDTKTAVIIFNRNKNFSGVLDKIRESVPTHTSFVRQLDYPSETGFRYVFRRDDDHKREFYLTVMAFDVPVEA